MNLLLINLSLRPESFKAIFPIGLGYIATAIKQAGFKFDLLDMNVHKFKAQNKLRETLKKKYDVIAFGCIVTGYKMVKEISKIIREENKDAIIICGNSVASSIPRILLEKTEVDIAVVGEGDVVIVDILRNKLFARKYSYAIKEPIKNLDDLPMLDWDLFDMRQYIDSNKTSIPEPHPVGYAAMNAMPINSARGCLFKCTFCYQVFCNNVYRYRSTKSIGKEVDHLKKKYGINYVTFYDDLTLFSRRRANDFADMMTGKDVYWTACCRADLFTEEDKRLLKRLKKANCISLGYSLESANADILKSMRKKISLEGFSRQKRLLDEAGIATLTSLVIGYPQETEETLNETFNFLYDNNIYPSAGYLLPQPATPMYDYAKQNGYIPDEEKYLLAMGDRQDLRLNMTSMSDEKMEGIVHKHLRRIRDKLKLDLDDEHLLKTKVVRGR